MKNYYLFLLKVMLGIALSICTLFSCNKENTILNEETKVKNYTNVSLKEAEYHVISNRKITNDTSSFWNHVQILWKEAYSETNEEGAFLVVPTIHNSMYDLNYDENGKVQETKRPSMQLLVYKDKNGQIESKFISLASKDKLTALKKMWLQSYSGEIIYYDINGNKLSVNVFNHGKKYITERDKLYKTIPSGRCSIMYLCSYTGDPSGNKEDLGNGAVIYGHSQVNYTPCLYNMTINGRKFTLTDHIQLTGCIDDYDGVPLTDPVPTVPSMPGGGTPTPTPSTAPMYESPGFFGPMADTHANRGIDCGTFAFTKTASNWQEAGVKNFRFKIFNTATEQFQIMVIKRPLYVGLPIERANGVVIPSNLASKIAAAAFQSASDRAHKFWQQNPTTSADNIETYVINWTRAFLQANGGTLSYRASTDGVSLKDAEYATIGNGNCN